MHAEHGLHSLMGTTTPPNGTQHPSICSTASAHVLDLFVGSRFLRLSCRVGRVSHLHPGSNDSMRPQAMEKQDLTTTGCDVSNKIPMIFIIMESENHW